jgi:peptide deformylase
MTDSAVMSGFGILQRGHPALAKPTAPIWLPEESAMLAAILERLRAVAALVRAHHRFVGGMGLAAPQIGVDRAVAIVALPGADEFLTLINPLVLAAAEPATEFEGCLSFFDVRARVPRPSRLTLRYQLADGRFTTGTFAGVPARLVGHEIDHLEGRLYTDLLPPDARLVPVPEYRELKSRSA